MTLKEKIEVYLYGAVYAEIPVSEMAEGVIKLLGPNAEFYDQMIQDETITINYAPHKPTTER